METFSQEYLYAVCQSRLDQFASEKGQHALPLSVKASLDAIVEITSKNLAVGRLARQNTFRAPSEQLTLEGYIDRVVHIWAEEQPIWCRLRARDPEMWRWLERDLTQAARRMLNLRHEAGSAAITIQDHVQHACLKIFRFDFHFDMPLLVWARSILKNTIRESDRSSDALDQWHFSLDVPFTPSPDEGQETGHEQADNRAAQHLEQIREREVILADLARMTPLRQAVLILTFFQESSDAEIVKTLDISMTHLHSTRHRALKQLCKFLMESQMQE